MPILYSAIGFNKVILNNYATCDGNFEEVTRKIFANISNVDKKLTYSHGRYLFHWISENKYTYFCITDKTCQRSRAFLFLNEIKRKYEKCKDNFRCVLAQEIFRYNEDYSTITIRPGELDEINAIGVDTTDKILGERILFVENDNNLKYMVTTYVEKSPEQVSIAIRKPNFKFPCIVIIIALGMWSIYNMKLLVISVMVLAIILMFSIR